MFLFRKDMTADDVASAPSDSLLFLVGWLGLFPEAYFPGVTVEDCHHHCRHHHGAIQMLSIGHER